MSGAGFLSKASPALVAIAVTACASTNLQQDVPDFVLQHTLSSLTKEQSFAWEESPGRSLVIRPLGTFKSGDNYCRDYQVALEGVRGKPVTRTACRVDGRWADVDPSTLIL